MFCAVLWYNNENNAQHTYHTMPVRRAAPRPSTTTQQRMATKRSKRNERKKKKKRAQTNSNERNNKSIIIIINEWALLYFISYTSIIYTLRYIYICVCIIGCFIFTSFILDFKLNFVCWSCCSTLRYAVSVVRVHHDHTRTANSTRMYVRHELLLL